MEPTKTNDDALFYSRSKVCNDKSTRCGWHRISRFQTVAVGIMHWNAAFLQPRCVKWANNIFQSNFNWECIQNPTMNPINQSINRTNNKSFDQSTNQPTIQPINQSIYRPINSSINQPNKLLHVRIRYALINVYEETRKASELGNSVERCSSYRWTVLMFYGRREFLLFLKENSSPARFQFRTAAFSRHCLGWWKAQTWPFFRVGLDEQESKNVRRTDVKKYREKARRNCKKRKLHDLKGRRRGKFEGL